MSFLDSTSSVVEAVLTRKGRELLAQNDGSFKIVKFAFGDDEINYQLYNLSTDDDSDILNLPILEPSSNEQSALRYRLITSPKGTIAIANIVVNPTNIVLGNPFVTRSGGSLSILPTKGAVTVTTAGGTDNSYTVVSRNKNIAIASVGNITLENDSDGGSSAIILVEATADQNGGTTIIDIIGNDTGAATTLSVTVEIV